MKYLSFIILSFFSLWGYAWPLDATLESSSPPLRALPGNIGLAPVSINFLPGSDSIITDAKPGIVDFVVTVDEGVRTLQLNLDLVILRVRDGSAVVPSLFRIEPIFGMDLLSNCGSYALCPSATVTLSAGESCCAEFIVAGLPGLPSGSYDMTLDAHTPNGPYHYISPAVPIEVLGDFPHH